MIVNDLLNEILANDIKLSISITNWPISFPQLKYWSWNHDKSVKNLKSNSYLKIAQHGVDTRKIFLTSNTRALKRVAINLIVCIYIHSQSLYCDKIIFRIWYFGVHIRRLVRYFEEIIPTKCSRQATNLYNML